MAETKTFPLFFFNGRSWSNFLKQKQKTSKSSDCDDDVESQRPQRKGGGEFPPSQKKTRKKKKKNDDKEKKEEEEEEEDEPDEVSVPFSFRWPTQRWTTRRCPKVKRKKKEKKKGSQRKRSRGKRSNNKKCFSKKKKNTKTKDERLSPPSRTADSTECPTHTQKKTKRKSHFLRFFYFYALPPTHYRVFFSWVLPLVLFLNKKWKGGGVERPLIALFVGLIRWCFLRQFRLLKLLGRRGRCKNKKGSKNIRGNASVKRITSSIDRGSFL